MQLDGQVAQHEQLVLAAVEAKSAAREVIELLLVVALDDEQAIAAARDRIAKRLGRGFEQHAEQHALEPATAGEQLARGEVAVDDVAAGIAEQHRDRRVLDHRVEQQLALDE